MFSCSAMVKLNVLNIDTAPAPVVASNAAAWTIGVFFLSELQLHTS